MLSKDDIEELLANDRWLSVAVDAQKVIRGMDDPLLREKEGLYLLLAGTDKGFLAVLNENDGSIQCSVKVSLFFYTSISFSMHPFHSLCIHLIPYTSIRDIILVYP